MIDPSRSWRRIAASVAVALVGGVVWAGWWASAYRASGPRAAVADASGPLQTHRRAALGEVVRDGLRVEFRIDQEGSDTGEVVEGRNARFEITITDTTGQIVPARVYPSAWVVAHANDAPPLTPRETVKRAESLINGSLFNPPELDLNAYCVVTLNDNATISVVDPRFGFGGTKLLALVPLSARGADWAVGPGGRRIFVAMPEVNRVALVDTQSWKVAAEVPGGVRPHRLAVQPDGRFVWVAGGAEAGEDSGVTILDSEDGRLVARIRTGLGRHDLAFSDDSRFAFVTNSDAGSTTIIDAVFLRVRGSITTGRRPTKIAYSPAAGLAYVSDAEDGTVCSIDATAGRVVHRIRLEPGVGPIRFAPSGGAGFVLNTERDRLSIIDPTLDRVVQETKVEGGPDGVAFSDEFAYIRHRGSANIVMISLKTAGREGAPLSSVSFVGGQSPPGRMDDPTPADSIVPAPGAGAMLVANPGDQSVYYYKEGLSAPMGTFSNYKRTPRAILVLDRSLRQREAPGVFETTARLGRPGEFDLVFVLNQPRIVHAFRFRVRPDPDLEAARTRGKVDVRPLVASPRALAGKAFRPLFGITDRTDGTPRDGLEDVEILMYRLGGGWHERRSAREIAAGIYGADFTPEGPGVYDVCIACASADLALNEAGKLTVLVVDPDETPGATPTAHGSHSP